MVKKNTLIVALWPVFRMSPLIAGNWVDRPERGQNDEKQVQFTNKWIFFTITITQTKFIGKKAFFLTRLNIFIKYC